MSANKPAITMESFRQIFNDLGHTTDSVNANIRAHSEAKLAQDQLGVPVSDEQWLNDQTSSLITEVVSRNIDKPRWFAGTLALIESITIPKAH